MAAILVGVVAVLAVLALIRSSGAPAQARPASMVADMTVAVVVGDGDSLWIIAQRLAPEADPRQTVQQIKDMNGLESSLIHPGEVLQVPLTP